jgi:glutathione S-transferase
MILSMAGFRQRRPMAGPPPSPRNAVLRILGQPRYPNSPGPPAAVAPLVAQQAGAISWGKQKALNWLKIHDKRLIGAHNNYLCGDTLTLADYQGA